MPGKRKSNEISGSNAVPTDAASESAGPSTSKSAGDASQSTTTLLISSLSPTYTSESLSTLLSSVGPIRVAFIVTSGQATASGQEPRSKGYGFAKFVLKDDAERAIQELNGTLIDGKKITVQWAKRRHRGDKGAEKDAPDAVETNADFVSLNGRDGVENVKNAYAARREQKRAKQDGEVPAVDNYKDARAVIIEGGLDVSDAATKKALQKKLKKVVFGINTGTAALQVHDIAISAATTSLTTSNNEEGQATTINVPQTVLECPTPKVANELAEKLHNTVLKGQLLLAKVKFESDLVERKGMSHGGGRLIVRNLGFDVTHDDLATAFCRFGPIQSIHLRKGYAFIWFIRKPDAQVALDGVNNTRIYHGMHADRIEEAAKHELTSVKRKKEKGRIVGLKGRIVAVDWALAKADYQKMEAGDDVVTPAEVEVDKEEDEDSDMEPVPYKSDDDDESDEEDEEEDDMSPVPEDLAAPSDIEDEPEEAKPAEHKPDQGTTLFVRNIQFEATEDELYNLFKAFGPVNYARIVMDPVTKRSRGTGFVNFYKEESALQCLEEADKLALTSGSGSGAADGKGNKGKGKAIPQSLLTADPSSALAAKLTLHGRVLGVSSAVSKGQADNLREERDRKGGNKDRRNLYLMHEGTILPESPLASELQAADVQNRQSSFEARRGLLRTNPALYVSRTRMAIRQIPLFVTEGMLKRLAGWAIKAFNNEVKAGRRSKLTIDELREPVDALGTAPVAAKSDDKAAEGAEEGAEGEKKKKKKKGKFGPGGSVKQAKILRADDRVDPLTGLKRSKGYGFLEMITHADALRFIRWANANSEVHKLLHRWWIEDLKDKQQKLSASDDKEKEARMKRIQDKVDELEKEDDKSVARQGKTLMVEFAIENAMTVKRRQEKTDKSLQKDKKRKREAEDKEEEEQEVGDAEAQEEAAKPEKERNTLGSVIGKKRRMKKAKRSG